MTVWPPYADDIVDVELARPVGHGAHVTNQELEAVVIRRHGEGFGIGVPNLEEHELSHFNVGVQPFVELDHPNRIAVDVDLGHHEGLVLHEHPVQRHPGS